MDSTDLKTKPAYQKKYIEASIDTIEKLKDQINNGIEVVPFIGAGISKPFGAPLWGDFLNYVFNEFKKSRRHKKTIAEIEELLNKSKLEEAADSLYNKDQELFEQLIKDSFQLGSSTKRFLSNSIVPDIARICNGTIITTNFDDILEKNMHDILNIEFDKIIPSRANNFFEEACEKLRHNEHVILKIHGDWSSKNSRVLTKTQYDLYYSKPYSSGELNLNNPLPRLINLLSASKILLFIGCSLESDRTLKVLTKLFNKSYSYPHYALLSLPEKINDAVRAEKRLRKAGINVIWYQVNPLLENPYEDLYKIVKSFAELSNKYRIIKNGKKLRSPISLHSTYLFESLRKSETVLRHTCNEHQYRNFAIGMLSESDALSKVIWTMYKSPLEVKKDLIDCKSMLSKADENFEKVIAEEKIRIVIFENPDELYEYCTFRTSDYKDKFEHKRISAFENSINRGSGKLFYATIDSLKSSKVTHLDIGYVHSEIKEEGIIFCSNINIDKKNGSKNKIFETIVFSSSGSIDFGPYDSLNLSGIKDIITSVAGTTLDYDSGGVYSDIKNLETWQRAYEKVPE